MMTTTHIYTFNPYNTSFPETVRLSAVTLRPPLLPSLSPINNNWECHLIFWELISSSIVKLLGFVVKVESLHFFPEKPVIILVAQNRDRCHVGLWG